MTRDEALPAIKHLIEVLDAAKSDPYCRAYEVMGSFVYLGMLKLDEPPSIKSRFRRAVSPIGQGVVGQWSENIWECIHLSGLEIVEK